MDEDLIKSKLIIFQPCLKLKILLNKFNYILKQNCAYSKFSSFFKYNYCFFFKNFLLVPISLILSKKKIFNCPLGAYSECNISKKFPVGIPANIHLVVGRYCLKISSFLIRFHTFLMLNSFHPVFIFLCLFTWDRRMNFFPS